MVQPLRVVIIKPSKYTRDGYVERFRWGFMPNSTVPFIRSMTHDAVGSTPIEIHSIDEYVHTDLRYLSLLKPLQGSRTLVALVGVQSHQFHRALDLGAIASQQGSLVVIGGPHVMTCDTSPMHGQGVSFAMAEAELTWNEILEDASQGELLPIYGQKQRWQQELQAPVIVPPKQKDLSRYIIPMLGLYPARGCPFLCNFCSVTKIAGRRIRSQGIDTTMDSLKAAKSAGVKTIMFTSDNFNKYPDAEGLLTAIVKAKMGLGFFVQCDTQIARQENLVELLAKAGCFQMFVGVESFNRETLLAASKGQNRPETYKDIVHLCRKHGISSHFSNIIGFPQDNEAEVNRHLAILREINPTVASFYILCPIPGTEQYDDFLSQGLIYEMNLDRFDGTCLTWRHPHFEPCQISRLLFDCYRRFFSWGHILSTASSRLFQENFSSDQAVKNMVLSVFSRYSAWRQTHPMSGGCFRVQRDGSNDYRAMRIKTFGFEMAPLPKSLQLSEAESFLNKTNASRPKNGTAQPARLAAGVSVPDGPGKNGGSGKLTKAPGG